MCGRVALIRTGRLAAQLTLRELRAAAPRRVTVTFAKPVCPPAFPCSIIAREPQRWVLEVAGPLGPLVSALDGLPVQDLVEAPFTIEETVLRLMNGERA